MQTYDTYKDSGIDWLGEIPEHWEVKKLKYIFDKIQTGTTPPTSNHQYFDGEISWYNPKDLNNEVLLSSDKKVSQKAVNDKEIKLFDGNSILVVGIGATAGKTSYLKDSATFNQQITGFKTHKYSNKYYFYLLKNQSSIFLSLALFTTLPILNNDFFKKVQLLIPQISEQESIAGFLDDKCGKIDDAVRIKEQQIVVLKELRQITIHNAVTRGVPCHAELVEASPKLKNSGIDWIGEIPEHWEVKRLKHLMKINNGLDYKHVQVEDGYPVIGSGGQFAYASKYLYDGEVLFLGRKGTIDKPLYFKGKFWTVDTMFYAIANINANTKYLFYLASTIPFKYYSTATALPSMTQNDLNNHTIAIPPIPEQEAIVSYLDGKTTKIDKAIAKKTEQIAKLKEYKQSLINEVVTGKVKVS